MGGDGHLTFSCPLNEEWDLHMNGAISGTNVPQPHSLIWTARASAVQLTFAGTQRAWLVYFICAFASPLPPYQQGPLIPQKGKLRLRPKGACLTMTTAPRLPSGGQQPGCVPLQGKRARPTHRLGRDLPQGGAFPALGVPDKALSGPCGTRSSQHPFLRASTPKHVLGL